jgi:hypothetical protein
MTFHFEAPHPAAKTEQAQPTVFQAEAWDPRNIHLVGGDSPGTPAPRERPPQTPPTISPSAEATANATNINRIRTGANAEATGGTGGAARVGDVSANSGGNQLITGKTTTYFAPPVFAQAPSLGGAQECVNQQSWGGGVSAFFAGFGISRGTSSTDQACVSARRACEMEEQRAMTTLNFGNQELAAGGQIGGRSPVAKDVTARAQTMANMFAVNSLTAMEACNALNNFGDRTGLATEAAKQMQINRAALEVAPAPVAPPRPVRHTPVHKPAQKNCPEGEKK